MNAVRTASGTMKMSWDRFETGTEPGARRAKVSAMTPIPKPAAAAAASPRRDTPPIVPRGTFLLRFVINLGLDLLNTPISDANVSAVVVATAPMKPPNIQKGSIPKLGETKMPIEKIIGIEPLAITFLNDLFPLPS